MHSVWFGEFLGTLVLILLGNGVNARRHAAPYLRSRRRLDGRHHRLGHRRALRSAGRPRPSAAPAPISTRPSRSPPQSPAATTRSLLSLWSAQCSAQSAERPSWRCTMRPHWSLTPDPAAKLGVFCTNGAVNHPIRQLRQRSHRHHGAGPRCRTLSSLTASRQRSRRRSRPVARRQPRLGHRPLARRNNRLRHQSRARSGPAHRARACCPSRQRRIELELRSHSGARSLAGGALAGVLLHFANL